MIYNCGNREHEKKLIEEVRNNPISKDRVQVQFGKLKLLMPRPRALLHFRIYNVLTMHNIHIHKDLVCYEGYDKKNKNKWIERCLNHFKTNAKYSHWNKNPIILSQILSRLIECYNFITLVGDMIIGMDHSIFAYAEEFMKNQHFRDITTKNEKYLNGRKFEDIETNILETDTVEVINEKSDKLLDLFYSGKIKLHPIYDFLVSGCNINSDQLRSLFWRGLVPQPDNPSVMYHVPITDGYLNGIFKKDYNFAEASIARLASLLSKSSIRQAGVLSKTMTSSVQNVKINDTVTREVVHDCDTKHYSKIFITNKRVLEQLEGKFMLQNGNLIPIKGNETNLIGNTISIRSIVKCASINVCEVCFGEYAYANQDIDEIFKWNFGPMVTVETVEEAVQVLLSAKHFSSGSPLPISILVDGKEVKLSEFPFISRKYNELVFINSRPFIKIGDLSYEEDLGVFRVNKFNLKLISTDKDVEIIFPENSGLEFRFNETVFNKMISKECDDEYISLEDMNKSTYIIPNKPLTHKYNMINMIKSASYLDLIPSELTSADDRVDWLLNFLITQLPNYHVIYLETLLRGLSRSKENDRRIPDWSQPDPSLVFYTGNSVVSVRKSPSVSRILNFGKIPDCISSVASETATPDEFDLLYQRLKPTENKVEEKSFGEKLKDIVYNNSQK